VRSPSPPRLRLSEGLLHTVAGAGTETLPSEFEFEFEFVFVFLRWDAADPNQASNPLGTLSGT
jgi:hypothetical protein